MPGDETAAPWLVVLAAGAGARMQVAGSKLALPVHGRPLLDWTLELAARALPAERTLVVVAPGGELEPVVRARAGQVVVAGDAVLGMAHSLHAGLAACPAGATGVVVALGDDPLALLALPDVLAAADQRPGECVAVRRVGGTPHPVYLPRTLWPAALGDGVDADIGLRHLLRGAHRVTSPAPEPIDADTPEDLARLTAALAGDDTP